MKIGNVAIIINAHFPYVRRAGRWPHGEEALYEVIAESYVPLLNMLHDLRAEGLLAPLNVSISPILLHQLADPGLMDQFTLRIAEWHARASEDLVYFQRESDGHGVYLANFYVDWIKSIEHALHKRFGRNLVSAIRNSLQDAIELLLAPATYAYLPHLQPQAIRAQLEAGAFDLLRQLGRRPTGLWLPGGRLSRGMHQPTSELQLQYAVGASWPHTAVIDTGEVLPVIRPDQTIIEHIVAPTIGYPGDGLYREFHRRHQGSGIAYWRVTGDDVPLHQKAPYDPYLAFSRASEHATHFVRAIRERLQAQVGLQPEPTVVVAFDAELFGHWWFEGVHWLRNVLVHLLASDEFHLLRLSELLDKLPPVDVATVAEIAHPLFDDQSIHQLRQQINQATARFCKVVRRRPAAEGLEEQLLTQAARELMLAQSSDWLALIVTETAQDYGYRRLTGHLHRFKRLIQCIERDDPSAEAAAYVAEIYDLDNPFPFLNYRVFI